MGPRAVLGACLLCLLLGGAALAAGPQLGPAIDGREVSPQLLAVTPPPEAPAEISLQDAVDLALDHNAGFRRSVQSLLAARSGLTVARQRWGLNAFGASERQEEINSNNAGAELTYAALTGANISLRSELDWLTAAARTESLVALLRQPLLAGRGAASLRYEELRSARTGYQSMLLAYWLARQDLIVQVVDAYLGAVQQEQLVAIQQESVQLADQAVKDAQLRLKEGLIIEIDLMRAELRLAQARSSEIQARQAQQDAFDQLLLLLGVRVQGAPKLVTAVAYQPQEQDVEAAVSYALEHRPELQIADFGVEDRAAALRIARSQRLPSLDLFGGMQNEVLGVSEQEWNVGLAATVPIGASSLREASRQADWLLLVAQQDREALRQEIIVEVRRQARAAAAARANVDIAEQAVQVAQKSLDQAKQLVDEGLDTNRNVLDAQNDLTNSRTTLATSRIGYYLSLVSLRRAMGMDVTELIALPAAPAAEGTEATPPAPTESAPAATPQPPPAGGAKEG